MAEHYITTRNGGKPDGLGPVLGLREGCILPGVNEQERIQRFVERQLGPPSKAEVFFYVLPYILGAIAVIAIGVALGIKLAS